MVQRLLVLATLEELIRSELVLREHTEDGVQLLPTFLDGMTWVDLAASDPDPLEWGITGRHPDR
jgi:hypothetical protein